jgi:hypothetical protein
VSFKHLLFYLFALAIVWHPSEIDSVSSTTITANYDVVYMGTDVPKGYLSQTVQLTGSPLGLSTSTINAGVAAGVRAQAVGDGFTVPANNVIMELWQAL